MYETGVKVEESLLKAEVALLTGGRDINGRPLVTFPAATIDKLAEVGSAGLVQVIRYYFSVSNPADRQQGFTFVADLQNSSQESNQVLVEALDFLQAEKRGSVSNFYALKPKSRAKSRCLKKQLGLKESKKNPKVASYPSSVLKIQSELYSRIDRTQLAPELGGTLQHNQHAWIQFHHMLDPLMEAVSRCQNLLPGAKDRVLLLQDYDTAGMTSYQLQTLMRELEDKYHGIMRELDVESTIDWSRQMAQRLQKPADEVVLSKVSPQLLKGTIDVLKQASQDLVQGREEMTSIWKDTENHFQKLHQLFHFKRDTTALCDDIARLWMPKVDQPANIGSTLSQAEMYRTYFISSLYDPAKVLVSEATELLEGIQHLHQDTPSLESGLDFVPGLAQLVQTFAEKLERLHNTYMAIHIFYLMFEKLAQWYQKVLRFIPSTLGSQVEKAKKQGKSSIPVLPKWAQAVRSFLNKHPGPRNEHISRIEYPVSILPDAQLCSQARLLAHRIRSLNKLLTSTQQFPLPEIANALSWKRRSLEGNDDIVIPSQVDPPLNKSYNTERDLDREVAEIGCVTNRTDDGKSEPFERPATALGLIDKKTQSVTFADELDSARDAPKEKRELSKSSQDLSQAPAADYYSEKGMRPASSFDILTDGGTSSLRVKGERFVSLSYSSQLQSMGMKNLHGTLPKSNRFKLPPSELEQMFSPPTPAAANTGSVVEQLQQIMNSGMSADEKLQQAQLVLQASSAQQPPPRPFFLSGNLSNPRHSLSGDQSTCGLKFYDLSPRVNGSSGWNKLSKKSYGSLTKSMPDLEEALRNTGARPKAPPAYDQSSALNGHASERSSQYNSSSTDRGQPGEIKSAREVRSAQRVGDWIEQHARTVHRHSQNLDADAETDDGYSEGSGDRQRRRPRKPRSDRKKEEGSSANNSQYGDLVDASRHKEEVESSLRRAQKILEEEEFNLNERKSKYAVDTGQREERRDGELTPGMSFDESAELPDSPGLSLDSSKSERTVPSESTDRGYGSSTTQPSPSPRKAQNRKNTSSSRPELGRSSSSDSASTLTSMEASPTPDSPNARPFIGKSKNQTNERSSPLMTKERRKSILRQPILKPSSPKVPSIPSLQPQISTHVPIIKSQSNKHLKPSKSMQDLLSIDENDNEPMKLRQTGLKARQARRKRMLSLITFNSNDHTMHSDQLSTQSRRLSMETIVEVPKQEESVHRESVEARANRRRRKRSDLKLGSGTNKNGLAISAEYASSSALDGDSSASQPESRSSGKQRPNSATEADKLGSMRKSQEAWDWNTKPGPTFNLVDSFRSKLSTHLKNAKDKVNENGTNSDNSQTNETLVTNGDACKSGADTATEHTQMSKTNGLNDTADDIEELSGFDDTEAQKQQAKIRLRRDVPCLKGVGPSSSYTMRGTRGSQGSLPKQYIRKNSRVFDGFQSESSGDCSPGRAGKSATISSAAGHRLIADDAWSLYR